ncbi:MAG: hypothetical protein J0L99_20490 [Chitinophagales bacterium]|nr:hypothetical protein [Chitinophagales bacterium]
MDWVKASGGQLRGFEFKWGDKTASAPKAWLENYPDATFQCINRNNFMDFVRVNEMK